MEQFLINSTPEMDLLSVIIGGNIRVLTDEQKSAIFEKLEDIKNIVNQ